MINHLNRIFRRYLTDEILNYEQEYDLELPENINKAIKIIEEHGHTRHVAYSLLKVKSLFSYLLEKEIVPEDYVCYDCGKKDIYVKMEAFFNAYTGTPQLVEVSNWCRHCFGDTEWYPSDADQKLAESIDDENPL